MGSLAFKLHFSIICHTKGVYECLIQNSKDCGAGGGGGVLYVRGCRRVWVERGDFISIAPAFCLWTWPAQPGRTCRKSPVPVNSAGRAERAPACRGKEPEPTPPGIARAGEGGGGCRPDTFTGTSPSLATGRAGVGRRATRPR